jgi:translation initiation factor IF-1
MKEVLVTMDGTVVGVNRNSATVELDNGSIIRGVISGRMMQHRIRIFAGDKVKVEMSPYDLTKSRITYRFNRL